MKSSFRSMLCLFEFRLIAKSVNYCFFSIAVDKSIRDHDAFNSQHFEKCAMTSIFTDVIHMKFKRHDRSSNKNVSWRCKKQTRDNVCISQNIYDREIALKNDQSNTLIESTNKMNTKINLFDVIFSHNKLIFKINFWQNFTQFLLDLLKFRSVFVQFLLNFCQVFAQFSINFLLKFWSTLVSNLAQFFAQISIQLSSQISLSFLLKFWSILVSNLAQFFAQILINFRFRFWSTFDSDFAQRLTQFLFSSLHA